MKKENMLNIIKELEKEYPFTKCGLDYTTPFELLLSLILAAQCTDKRVNIIRPILTKAYPTPEDIYSAGIEKVFKIISSCSFPNNKAKHIIDASYVLIHNFNSVVPCTMEDLTTIPGIGRKSANIILNECFGKIDGIAIDTHATRLSYRLGFTKYDTPKLIEKDLMKKLPKKYWCKINHLMVEHGRKYCIARKPKCNICPINDICPKKGV